MDDRNLTYLGIYKTAIDDAVDRAENALSKVDLDDKIDELNEGAVEKLKEVGNWDDITNSIIFSYFNTAKSIIENFMNVDVSYYVNSNDSHICIDGEEVFAE